MEEYKYHNICSIRSPAKAILCGEHAVVYGQDAIAIAIGLYCRGIVSSLKKQNTHSTIHFQLEIQQDIISIHLDLLLFALKFLSNKSDSHSFQTFQKQSSIHFAFVNEKSTAFLTLHYKLALFLEKYSIDWRNWSKQNQNDWNIRITSEIPLGKCLGSSAAFNSVISSAFFVIFNKITALSPISLQLKSLINQISFLFQKVEHGTPSGVDNFVTVHGGLILFNRNKQPKFRQLSSSIQKFKKSFMIAIADSKVQKNTKFAVDMVRERCRNNEEDRNKIKLIGQITYQIQKTLESEDQIDQSIFFSLIQQNHELLKQLGLSRPQIQKLISIGQQNGWTGKITGSGMGGCVLFLASPNQINQHQLFTLTPLEQNGLTISFDEKK